MKHSIHIGTSGWHYKHWKGIFYPEDVKEKGQLMYYQQHFSTVELNSPFYHIPKESVFANWRKATPDNFLFAVKASRYITHMKKLENVEESTQLFLSHAAHLEEKLGPILFQLPPSWKVDLERLEIFLASLPQHFRYTFEFRNRTWYIDEVYRLLKKYNCAFCIYELAHHLSPEEVTADFVYIRLHGPEGKYQGSYPDTTLDMWAKKCKEWKRKKKDVFVYFDNDEEGHAPFNATRLIELIG